METKKKKRHRQQIGPVIVAPATRQNRDDYEEDEEDATEFTTPFTKLLGKRFREATREFYRDRPTYPPDAVAWWDERLAEDLREHGPLFLRRVRIVKAAAKAADEFKQHIKQAHPEYLYFSREAVYPTKWMARDARVARTMRKYPKLCLILNYVFSLNRRSWSRRAKSIAAIAAANAELGVVETQRQRGKQWPLSLFRVGADFYSDAAKTIECSAPLVQKMMAALIKADIYRVVLDNKKPDPATRLRLLADGYFVGKSKDGTARKIAFLNRKAHLAALRSLNMSGQK